MSDSNREYSKIKRPIGYIVAGISAAALSVAIFASAQYFFASRVRNPLDNAASALTTPAPSPSGVDGGVQQLKKTAESFRQVAKLVGPAVVNIKSTKGMKKAAPAGRRLRRGRQPTPQQPQTPPGGPGGGDDEESPFGGGQQDPFYDFFQRFGHPFMGPEMPQTSLGSGIIVDKKGYVVTNNHVVEDASEILITLSNEKTELKAKVVGTDPKTDLALLKVETAKDLPVAEWADSDQVEVGDWAIAIGSPFDLRQTVTVGIVSAKGRSSNVLGGAEYAGDLIQTDAAINPGNSGGPLCTIEGKIMGVNTAIYTRSGGYMGIGFAIPSNLAKDVVSKLRTDGKVVRGWLGVYIQSIDPELAKELGVKDGVSVHEVMDGSPAAEAGLQAGDVVLEVEGNPVSESNQLQRLISNFKPNQKVKMKVLSYNDRKTRTVTVKIGTVPETEAAAPKVAKEEEAPDKIGLVVADGKKKDGVTIVGIQPNSPAEGVGLEPGDLITRVNGKPVNSIATYKKLVNSAKRLINFEVKQKGRTRFFSLPLPE